jgi:cytochrome c oxidase cbb3-type subunit IV
MDQGTMQGIGTILAMVAFLAVCWWAFSKHKKKDFDEASLLPFDQHELKGLHGSSGEKRNERQV